MNTLLNQDVTLIDLGLIEYAKAWDYQQKLFARILESKAANRDRSDLDYQPTENFIIACQHPHVFTLGKSGDEKNLLISKDDLASINASYYPINRGGDITYHGPGQLVVYPVLDLENFFTDIHRYMRTLEEAVILTLAEYNIPAIRIPGLTGVWIEGKKGGPSQKICAMGVKTSRWVTLHGLALNVNTDLSYFDYIIPCGISGKEVTSMEKQMGNAQSIKEVYQSLSSHLLRLFGMTVRDQVA